MNSTTVGAHVPAICWEAENDCRKLIKCIDRERVSMNAFLVTWLGLVIVSGIYIWRLEEIMAPYSDSTLASCIAGGMFLFAWLMIAGELWESGNTFHRLPVSAVHNAGKLDVPISYRIPYLAEA